MENQIATARSYEVRTYGCQMNVHDSERLSGLLDDAGYTPLGDTAEQADVVVFNTCAVRENADNRLYGNLGRLKEAKARRPGLQIAVGGCLAQKDRDAIVKRAPWVDVVFGTHNIGSLPALLDRARHNAEAQVEIHESLQQFPSTLPTRRESAGAGWVSISVGCNNTCTFCIVPALRGKEKDRRPGDILAEVEALVADGVIEVTLLGQNVNSYGSEFRDRQAFSRLLRAVGAVPGLERVRFTSPHPAAFTDDVIAAMAETPSVMPQLHMPLQSGSDRILKAMRRSYRSSRFLGILERVRQQIEAPAITTDIIVGFPGETEEDFAETLRVVEESRFAQAFTFQYSQRPGTPAASLPDQLPKAVVQERFERLTALQDRISLEENRLRIGQRVEVMLAEGDRRTSERLSGRAADNRLVHLRLPEGIEAPRPGDMVTTVVTEARPSFLLADDPSGLTVRRTTAGDAWDRRQLDSCGAGSPAASPAGPTSLGDAGDAPAERVSRLLVPGTALMLTGVDPGEEAPMRHLRSTVASRLRARPVTITLAGGPAPAADTVIASLGGIGIDRAVRLDRAAHGAWSWHPTPTGAIAASDGAVLLDLPDAILVLLAVEAEVSSLRLRAPGEELDAAAVHLGRLDLPAASHHDAPLPHDRPRLRCAITSPRPSPGGTPARWWTSRTRRAPWPAISTTRPSSPPPPAGARRSCDSAVSTSSWRRRP